MFTFFDPRGADLVLGVVIGLSLSLVVHWMHWFVR